MKSAAAIVAAVGSVAFSACSLDSVDKAGRPRAPGPVPLITVTMRDHRFDYDGPVPSGLVLFRIRNAGQATHHLTMAPLPEDLPPIGEQLRGTERRFLSPFAGIYDRKPGDTGTFVVSLVPGRRYAMICAVRAEDGEPHWRKGMFTEFRTPGSPPATTATTTTTAPPFTGSVR